MLTAARNDMLTRVGPGTPMGELLRRYWQPIAGSSELDDNNPIKTVRILGENFMVGTDTVFYARIVQDGTAAVAVRSPKGMPLWKNGKRLATNSTANREGAL